jgi:predicted  nucleic acid-binding Zn-ribbon protein
MVKEPTSVHKCLICGNIMSCGEYEANGCIFCGSNAEPLVCWESYDVRDRE